MSGDEADESSVGDTSSEEEDIPLPVSPFKSGTDEPFKVVFKGGSPWGFDLKGGTESKAPLQVSQIEPDGKAAQGGQLQLGDYVLSINDVRCTSKIEAEQLIYSAFRTLTLQVWRGTSEPVKSPGRSSSFLLKARELQERARQQAAAQDDSAVFAESKSATSFRMKPRQRRIESFHGRRPSAQSTSSLSSSSSTSTKQPQRGLSPRGDPVTYSPPTSSTDNSGLKGWATENDLTSGHRPIIMSGSHMTASSHHVQLASSKSTPSLHQEELQAAQLPLRGYSPAPPQSLTLTKSSPDVSESNYENVTSPLSPKSPSWYQQRFPNRASAFDFSSAAVRRAQGSPRNSYAGYSPSYSQSTNFPMSSANSYAVSNTGVFSSSYMDPNSQRATSSQSHIPSGASFTSYDDTPTRPQKKNYDRRSLPPQALYNLRHDYQKENVKPEPQTQKPLKSMPTTREENESDSEIPDITPRPPNDLDLRPMYSPPAPPVRDISSLKYVGFNQNHEKYPSWPVTTANPPPNLGGPPVNANLNEKDNSENTGTDSTQNKKFEAQMSQLSDKSSPSIDRRGSDESKQPRNASDPGFKQKPKKSFYTTRKPKFEPPKERDYENLKTEEERFNEFCSQSKPGYPPPKFDPDGHNYGDEKYNIPSPPERDIPNTDDKFEKSLVEKINSVINPGLQYQSPFHFTNQYSANSEGYYQKSHKTDTATSPLQNSNMSKIPGMYFQQAMNSQNLLHLPNQSKNMVDSGTSPLSSPNEEKGRPGFRTLIANPRSESFQNPSTEKSRGLIIRQMPYYNTSTQTDDANIQGHQSKPFRNSADIGDQSRFMEKSVQAHMSHSSVNSDSESVCRISSEDHERYLRKDFSSDSRLNQPMSLPSSATKSETSSQSSGIGSLSFSDQSSAPMLRKLSEEFYRGKLGVSVPNEKRMSAVNYEDLKSPRSESLYGGLKEAESLSSVVIHPHESSGPFGQDYGSSPSLTSSKQDVSDFEHDPCMDPRHSNFQKPRHSIDSTSIFHKATTSMVSMPPRSLQDSRFTSENNLSSPTYGSKNYSQSMMQLNKPPSVSDSSQRNSAFSSESGSSSSRPHGSMEARSSGSRISSDSSTPGTTSQRSSANIRHDSDSVFFDKAPPVSSESQVKSDDQKTEDKQGVGIGRKVSMKMAYGTFDESEHHYATPYAHQRNNSENLSPQAKELNISHVKSQSCTSDYMPMHYSQSPADLGKLDQIQEEESEVRWQEAVRKSKSLNREVGNYMNIETSKEQTDSSKSDKKNGRGKTGMKRTVSEQIRPRKNEAKKKANDGANKEQSSSGESSKGNKSDGEGTASTISQHYSDSDLKKVQQKAVLDFIERKTKPRGSDDSEPHSPNKDNPPDFPTSTDITPTTPVSPSPIMMDITRKYNYTRAQRAESLRRSRSVASNSSYDSADYVDMKRPERNYQTEWSRLRSQGRPLSIGSDTSGSEHYMTKLSPMATSEEESTHVRSASETMTTHTQNGADSQSGTGNQPGLPSDQSSVSAVRSNETMVTAPIYQNLGEYPRRPPPPVPGVNSEDQPPALPPRSFQQQQPPPRFLSSKSESFLFSNIDPKQADDIRESAQKELIGHKKWENSPREDTYAEQLRKQARRYSEQQPKPMSMQVLATKSPIQVSMSQSFKQEPVQAFEAKPLQKFPSTQTDSDSLKDLHSPLQKRDTASPELPPLPTPLKNGDVEMKVDLNDTADFPPPPAEFAEEGEKDRCADDSYGSYKTRTSRELGKYKRTVSDSNVVKAQAESSRLQAFTELSSADVAETPSKPPRKKLELQGRESPTQGQGTPRNFQGSHQGPVVPTFHATESKPSGAQKLSAQPLEAAPVCKQSPQMAGNAGSFISTVVQRPNANLNADRTIPSQQDENVPSVKDRIKNIEVISHSPGSGKGIQSSAAPTRIDGIKAAFESDSKSDRGTPRRGSESLEKLESSVRSSNSFRDRLRPVVRKVENNQMKEEKTNSPAWASKVVDSSKVEGTPPVPVRTYKNIESQNSSDRPPRPSSKPGESSDSPYRRNSFQLRHSALSHPRPYENRTETSANVQSPSWAKSDNVHNESVKKSVPEPQVPSRVPLRPHPGVPQPHRGQANEQYSSDKTYDQNQINSSRDQRLSSETASRSDHLSTPSGRSPNSLTQPRKYESPNATSYSVQVGQKRKSDNSFTTSSTGTRSQSTSSYSQNMTSESRLSPGSQNQIRTSDNVHYDKYQNNSQFSSQIDDRKENNRVQRPYVGEGSSSVRDRHDEVDRSPAQSMTRYQSGDYKSWRSNNEKAEVDSVSEKNRPESQAQFVSNSPQDYSTKNSPQDYSTKNSPQDYSTKVREERHNRKNSEEKNRTSSDKLHDNVNTANVTISHRRVPSHEELECDEKAQELARVLNESDKQLSQVLMSDSNKIRMQYMDGLFQSEGDSVQARPRSASKKESVSEEKDQEEQKDPTSTMPSNYYVSPPKAMIELEIRKFGDTSPLTQGLGDNDSLAEKKEELLQRMLKKVDILKDDKKELLLEIEENERLGKQVADVVEQKCRSHQEKEKFRSYIEDMDKIIRLLLKLSGLLARAENTIQGLTENTNEKIKKMTYDKRDRLHQQHEDAKELKVDIDRRRENVEGILKECLLTSELDDYHYFIKMKSKYTIQMQELEDKITLGNEQISALQKSIPNKK